MANELKVNNPSTQVVFDLEKIKPDPVKMEHRRHTSMAVIGAAFALMGGVMGFTLSNKLKGLYAAAGATIGGALGVVMGAGKSEEEVVYDKLKTAAQQHPENFSEAVYTDIITRRREEAAAAATMAMNNIPSR